MKSVPDGFFANARRLLEVQEEFLNIAQDFRIEELNLLDSFDRNNLSLLAERSNQLEKTIRGIIAERG